MVAPSVAKPSMPILQELVERHRKLYEGPEIDVKLERLSREGSQGDLSAWDIHRLLRTSRSVYFDTHVEVVSGHHTATYLRFESIARFPQLVTLIARDMAEWLLRTFRTSPLAGIVATSSDARLLAEKVGELLADRMPLRIVLTPFNHGTGKIGTDVALDAIQTGDRFVSLNDVTTRGMCVSKLGTVITDHRGQLAGMMVFARRDSGQFPLMDELTAKYPFYFSADLHMLQWEPSECPMCQDRIPLLLWKDLPEL
jgi:orotate phosphoribosyltransferase